MASQKKHGISLKKELMKKINLKGRLSLNKQTVSKLNDAEKSAVVGGHDTKTDSRMTVQDTYTCHCDSQMTVMDTYTCHCDEKTKTKGC